ncbi:MAG: hypothetical protein ACYSR6_08895, partial [Planctomycetota bacterium]
MEAGEIEDVVVAVEFDSDGDDASAGRRHGDIVNHGAGGDKYARYGTVLIKPVARGQYVNAGDALALAPKCTWHCVTVAVMMGQVKWLWRPVES